MGALNHLRLLFCKSVYLVKTLAETSFNLDQVIMASLLYDTKEECIK